MEPHFYTVNVSWSNERKGMMCSPELAGSKNTGSCIEVATPPEFPKGIPGIWSPEHLFTAAVSSCLMTTFLAVADNSKLDFVSFDCHSRGKLEQIDNKFVMSEVILEPTLVIRHAQDRERAERILQKAEAACLITNSVKSKVTMTAHVTVGS
jgi:organic hydroperoxide reductase OsmC/OhrA